MTQVARVLADLRERTWTCSQYWYATGCPNARNRVCELEAKGFEIVSRRCESHAHGPTGFYEYRLTHDPEMVQAVWA